MPVFSVNDFKCTGSATATGPLNGGIVLSASTVKATAGGSIALDGAGGGSSSQNPGIALSDTDISVVGDGTITIDGTGSAAGTILNEGVLFNVGSTVSVEDGDLTITGTGGGSMGQGIGVVGTYGTY